MGLELFSWIIVVVYFILVMVVSHHFYSKWLYELKGDKGELPTGATIVLAVAVVGTPTLLANFINTTITLITFLVLP